MSVIGFICLASFFDFESPVTDLEPPLGMNVAGPSGASVDGQPAIKMRCAPGEVIVSGAIIGSCCSTACDPGGTSCECKACHLRVGDGATIANRGDSDTTTDGQGSTSDDAASIFSWSASMRCTTSQAFKDRIHYINCTSIVEQAWADPDYQRACAAETAAAARAAAATCGWRCDLLFWYPVGALAASWLLLLVAAAFDIQNLRSDDELMFVVFLSAVWTFLCVWPLIWSSPFGAAWVSMFVGPLCAGGMPTFVVTFWIAIVAHVDDDDDSVFKMASAMGLISWLGYIYVTWDAREHKEVAFRDETNGLCFSDDQLELNTCLQELNGALTDASVELLEFSCTATCLAMRWTMRSFGVIASIASLFLVKSQDMCSEDSACLRIPAFLAFLNACLWWPELVSDEYFATGLSLVTYCCVLFCFCGGWFVSLGELIIPTLQHRCCQRINEWVEGYELEVPTTPLNLSLGDCSVGVVLQSCTPF